MKRNRIVQNKTVGDSCKRTLIISIEAFNWLKSIILNSHRIILHFYILKSVNQLISKIENSTFNACY